MATRRPWGYWTKERVMADARKYTYKRQWVKACSTPSIIARREGWLDEACAHMESPIAPVGYWTAATILADAKKYARKGEWKKRSGRAYDAAQRRGLLPACTAHMDGKKSNGYWTKARCLESARKYDTIVAWSTAEISPYQIAKRRGWMPEATKHMVRVFSHGERTIYSLLLQHDVKFEYQKRFEGLKVKNPLPFDFYLPDHGLLIEYQGRQHFDAAQTSMFRKNLPEQRRRDAMKRRFAKKSGFAYLAIEAQKVGDIEAAVLSRVAELAKARGLGLHRKRRELTARERKTLSSLGKWSKEAVLEDARRFDTLLQWTKCGNAAWQIAYKNGWIAEATAHMTPMKKPTGYWTKPRVLADAKQYATKIDWIRSSGSAYGAAHAQGWVKEASAHMVRPKRVLTPAREKTKAAVLRDARKYSTAKAWRTERRHIYAHALRMGWVEEATAHMPKRSRSRSD